MVLSWPSQTALYEQGVGLGASKAKEVTNFQGYREMARDSVQFGSFSDLALC